MEAFTVLTVLTVLTEQMKKSLSLDMVTRAYNGKSGCMCGCLGNYRTAYKQHVKYSDDELNARAVKTRFNKVMNADRAYVDLDPITADIKRAYIDGARTTVLFFG